MLGGSGFEDGACEYGCAPGESVQAYLRRATRPWHDAVESDFASFDLSTLDGLGGFLNRQATAVLPLEQALNGAGIAALVPDWTERRRSRALLDDLRALGLSVPAVLPAPGLPSTAHALGCLYVLEGSKLGGRILLRRAAGSSDARVRGALRFLGHNRAGEWPRIVALLQAVAADDLQALRAGAETAFALFRATAASNLIEVNRGPLVHFAHA